MRQLAEEYRHTADMLSNRLIELRLQLAYARGEQYFQLQRRIEAITQELFQVRQTMGYLMNYYDESAKPAHYFPRREFF